MAAPHILIVDDEPNVQLVLENALKRDGYSIDRANDGLEAIRKLGQTSYDLVLLDLNMKPVDGIQVLNNIHERGCDTVVIILTGHSSIDSAVGALRLGAFDYLYKPASPELIRQRVHEGIQHHRQALHRSRLLSQIESLRQNLMGLEDEDNVAKQVSSPTRFLQSGSLVVDKYHRTATLGGKLLELTTTEFDLLTCLAEAAPAVVSSRQLVLDALNYAMGESEAREIIKYHIYQLRKKIEENPSKPKYIKTIRYKGYLWSG
ncbi:MAG TPA: response regulator transcription factor [Longilinea sp.]|nr:response regulator transcription factor [Longilinea sp.]